MAENIAISVLFLFLLYYLNFLWSIWTGLSRLTIAQSGTTAFSTVVIAVRNEERNIEQCLRALSEQDCNPKKFEVIVVDDHSEDHTLTVANRVAGSFSDPTVTVVSLRDQSGKPAAIALGVSIAKGEVILCTDADCVVPKKWVESMVGCFDSTVAFVAGPVLERPTDSLVS